jgi:hypothetical protein
MPEAPMPGWHSVPDACLHQAVPNIAHGRMVEDSTYELWLLVTCKHVGRFGAQTSSSNCSCCLLDDVTAH